MPSDDGYFPRGRSVLRRVQEQRAVGLLYGQRALMIGAAHPVNFTGTMVSTASGSRPWRRLAHTGKVFETVFFGSRAEADRALAFVEGLHRRVKGTLPEAAGAWPAGTNYSAFDPELMLWTVAVMADSAEVLHDTLIGSLSEAERERLWRDYVRFGEMFGMPRDVAPASHGEFRAWWGEMLTGDKLHLTEEALLVGSQIAFAIPVPLYLRSARWPHNLVLLGTVPERIRDMYGLAWAPAHEAAFRALTMAVRRSRRLVPGRLRRGSNTVFFDLVARTEEEMLRRGASAMRYAG